MGNILQNVFQMKKTGELGEEIIKNFLQKRGFNIIGKNLWLKKYGEIDIIAEKNKIYYFIEVKTLKYNENFDPSLHFTKRKREKLHNLIIYYSNKNKINEFKALLATVQLGPNNKIKIKFYENV